MDYIVLRFLRDYINFNSMTLILCRNLVMFINNKSEIYYRCMYFDGIYLRIKTKYVL